jgi:hypothetical protein
MGQKFLDKPCNWRMPSSDILNTGCTINETGHCSRSECPFEAGYLRHLTELEELCLQENSPLRT